MSRRPRRPRAGLVAPVALGLLVAGLAGCSSGSDESAPPAGSPSASAVAASPAAVALDSSGVPSGLKIGIVVSLTSPAGEGSQWQQAAEGARVAAYRYQLGGSDVVLVPADDKGTAAGATAAVDSLSDQGVAGIVMGTSGRHLRAAMKAATAAGVPLLLPYDSDDRGSDLPDSGVWVTGPSHADTVSALARALKVAGDRRPVLVDGGGVGRGLPRKSKVSYRDGRTTKPLVSRIRTLASAPTNATDSVVVSGPATLQATVVQALQNAGITLPVYLTPDALSPVLARQLSSGGGSLSVDLVTAGENTGDVAAMLPTAPGRALSAYFAALRSAAADPDVKDFFDNQPFAGVATVTDTRSHDAVVALVQAATAADSTDPAAVAAALADLTLSTADGLVGPPLDFSSSMALRRTSVVALQATTQDPGIRPTVDGEQAPRLFWFRVPAAS